MVFMVAANGFGSGIIIDMGLLVGLPRHAVELFKPHTMRIV
jgi:hypothetical protein